MVIIVLEDQRVVDENFLISQRIQAQYPNVNDEKYESSPNRKVSFELLSLSRSRGINRKAIKANDSNDKGQNGKTRAYCQSE